MGRDDAPRDLRDERSSHDRPVFGGYDFTQADATRTPAVAGYAKGVPMGGDLPAAPAGKAPTFLVAALKDRFSGNLDRIQIIKGWLGKDGKPQEKIYDVVWGDKDRRKIVNGKLTPVGTPWTSPPPWTNTIGDPELVTVWKDPDFDPSVRAVYYARVLEIPTPRWTAYDAAYFKIKITDPKVPMTTQERAFVANLVFAEVRAMRIRTLLGEPMLHFLLIGIALFAALSMDGPSIDGRRIVITQGVVDDLVTQHGGEGREPSATELNHLIESYVRDEILYRKV